MYRYRVKEAMKESGAASYRLFFISPRVYNLVYNSSVEVDRIIYVNTNTLKKICRLCNVSADFLLGLSDSAHYIG